MAKLNLLAIDKVELRKRFKNYVTEFSRLASANIKSGPIKAYDTGQMLGAMDQNIKYDKGQLVGRVFINSNLLQFKDNDPDSKLYPIYVHEGTKRMRARPYFDKAWEQIQKLDVNIDNILYVK